MPDFADLTLLPFCTGLTLLGLIATWTVARRRGPIAGIRGLAWSLLPVSLYLTGLLELVWDVLKAGSDWIVHLVFSPTVWAGVVLFGVSVVLFVVSGLLRNRGGARPAVAERAGSGELTATGPAPASAPVDRPGRQSKQPAASAGEFDEVEDILKRHGIS